MLDADIDILEASKRRRFTGEEGEEEAFHFIAYVPIGDSLWELDGLKRQPVRLGILVILHSPVLITDNFDIGNCTSETWLKLATPKIQERILRYEQDEIRFTLLAIVRKPLTILRENLTTNTKMIGLIERRLDVLYPGWRTAVPENDVELEMQTDAADIDQAAVAEIGVELDTVKLSDRRAKLIQEQNTLKLNIREEEEKLETYTTYATRKQHDYSPFIRKMLGFLAEKRSLQQYIGS